MRSEQGWVYCWRYKRRQRVFYERAFELAHAHLDVRLRLKTVSQGEVRNVLDEIVAVESEVHEVAEVGERQRDGAIEVVVGQPEVLEVAVRVGVREVGLDDEGFSLLFPLHSHLKLPISSGIEPPRLFPSRRRRVSAESFSSSGGRKPASPEWLQSISVTLRRCRERHSDKKAATMIEGGVSRAPYTLTEVLDLRTEVLG